MVFDIKKKAYYLFYFFSILTFLASVFKYQAIVYVKPFVLLMLSVIYFSTVQKKDYLFLLSIILIMMAEILSVKDFSNFFPVINGVLALYYVLNIILLSRSLSFVKIEWNSMLIMQLFVTMTLLVYILYSVISLVLPLVQDFQLYLMVLSICFTLFLGVCYYIYIATRTILSAALMVAASCFLIVNVVTILNEIYMPLGIFAILTHVLQIVGQFFLIKFLMAEKKTLVYKRV